mmetsp:Transcript_32833/g.96820  ORF Transcript_32833/g.96820 Transcript_32833/m.96820 type:complete len:364 (+) Transcript_32833:24-1115(+)
MMLRSTAAALSALLLLCATLSPSSAFVANPAHVVASHRPSVGTIATAASASPACAFPCLRPLRSTAADEADAADASGGASSASASASDDPLGLTPELRKMTDAFASIPDEKMRYKQLLFMAGQLPPVDAAVQVPANKVPGCLSTVYVDCTLTPSEGTTPPTVQFVGDSDGLLTKGLVALLIRGLSGCTPDQIEAVDPEFIHAAKISQSLTPGRNNGFLNMIAVMKAKAREIAAGVGGADGGSGAEEAVAAQDDESAAASDETIITTFEQRDGKPMYNEILSKLIAVLKPAAIRLVDNSDQHAGHAGSKGWEESGESHFALEIVSEAFGGLAAVKRHQLIYMLLGETMEKIHALQISAKTPEEV